MLDNNGVGARVRNIDQPFFKKGINGGKDYDGEEEGEEEEEEEEEEEIPILLNDSENLEFGTLSGETSSSYVHYFRKGTNGGKDGEEEQEEEENFAENIELDTLVSGSSDSAISGVLKKALNSMTVVEFYELIRKIEAAYVCISTSCDIRESFKESEACETWMKIEVGRTIPSEHVSILGNLEEFGVLEDSTKLNSAVSTEFPDKRPAVVEFGAGTECMAQVLAHCYGIQKMLLVDKKPADERVQEETMILEHLSIDIKHLDLTAVEFLKGMPFLAIGNRLCGSATDLALRCCLPKQTTEDVPMKGTCNLRGLAIATCCHYLCRWKHYQNKIYITDLGFKKDDFHMMSLLTFWETNQDLGSCLSNIVDERNLFIEKKSSGQVVNGAKEFVDNMTDAEVAVIGRKCKVIIDMGRLMWIKQLSGFKAELVKYVPTNNHLLIAKYG